MPGIGDLRRNPASHCAGANDGDTAEGLICRCHVDTPAVWRPLSARKEIGKRVIYLKWKFGRQEMPGPVELP